MVEFSIDLAQFKSCCSARLRAKDPSASNPKPQRTIKPEFHPKGLVGEK